MTNCIVMKAIYPDITSVIKVHQSSLCQHLQESYINVFYRFGTIHLDSVVIMFTQLFKLSHLSILHVHIIQFSSNARSEEYTDNQLLLEMEKALSTNHSIKEFLFDVSHFAQCNTLINSLLTGVKRLRSVQFFSLSLEDKYNSAGTQPICGHDLSLEIEELLKNNQTLQAFKLDLPIKGILPFLFDTPVNESLTALNISNDTVHDIVTYPLRNSQTLSTGLENIGRNITNLKSLSLYKPLIPLINYFNSSPLLKHLDILLEREESLHELFSILSSNTTIIALRIKCEPYGLFRDEVGKSLQVMLSSNKSLQCLDIENLASNSTLLIKYLTTGLKGNNTLQELNIKFSEFINLKEFFEATDNLKSLTVSYGTWKIPEQVLTSLYYEEIIHHVRNMLERNEDINFLKVIFFPRLPSQVTYKEDWIPMIYEFWKYVLLHPSLCYVGIIKTSVMKDIIHNMKKTLIRQRTETNLGPYPMIEVTGSLSQEEYEKLI